MNKEIVMDIKELREKKLKLEQTISDLIKEHITAFYKDTDVQIEHLDIYWQDFTTWDYSNKSPNKDYRCLAIRTPKIMVEV